MKIFLRSFFLLVISITKCAGLYAIENKHYIFQDQLINKSKVYVVIETESISDEFVYGKPVWWGAEFVLPKTITKNIIVTLDGNKSWIRFSAYSDLVNLKSAKLTVFKNGFQISIDGGESSTHYIANLNFDNEGFLISRKVYSPKFPDEVWEETRYSFIRRNYM